MFFAQNHTFSKSETETFQTTVKDMGLELATVQKSLTTDTDLQSQATNAINVKPDLIIISGLAADGGNSIKQLRDLGYNPHSAPQLAHRRIEVVKVNYPRASVSKNT